MRRVFIRDPRSPMDSYTMCTRIQSKAYLVKVLSPESAFVDALESSASSVPLFNHHCLQVIPLSRFRLDLLDDR